MKNFDFDTVLMLGAHTDDEFGCCGTIIRLLESGAKVSYAVFSTCEESVPLGYPKDILLREMHEAAKTIGIPEKNLFIYNYRVRHFPSKRQEILEDLVMLRDRIEPDLVLLPAFADIHQDHQVIAQEGFRAFKFASVLGYELPMNTITFTHACFIEMKEEQLRRKIESLKCYKSQQFRSYASEEFIRSLAKVRGIQAGVDYAEAFEVIRIKY